MQSAQQAMSNADTGKEKLEGFISKIEDWHRMMNFLEVIDSYNHFIICIYVEIVMDFISNWT